MITRVLLFLEPFEQGAKFFLVPAEIQSHPGCFLENSRLTGQFTDQYALLVAHQGRIHMLKSPRVLEGRAHVQSALVREGVLAHVGLVRFGAYVHYLGNIMRSLCKFRQSPVADTAVSYTHLR